MADEFIPDSEFKPDPEASPKVTSPVQEQTKPPDLVPDESFIADEDKYGTAGQGVKAFVEGAGRGLGSALFTGLETGILHNAEEQRMRQEQRPILSGAGEITGLVAPALISGGATAGARAGISGAAEAASVLSKAAKFTQAGMLEKAGAKVVAGLGLGGKEASILGKIGAKSVSEAAQMAMLQGGDEISKMIQHDPNQTADTVAAHIGMATVLGGGAGAIFGAVPPLWKATVGDKAGQLIEDFKGRMGFHLENPEPTKAVTDELTAHYDGVRSAADEVYGPSGLKSQDVAKAMPEMHPGIPEQSQKLANHLEERIVKMKEKPNSFPERLVSKAEDDFNAYRNAIQDPNATPGSIFNATQDLKQTMQGYSKYDKFVKPVDEAYDFVREAKGMASKLRESLEDSDVWGKAADRQKAINKAFTEYLPTLKDFEKKFTSEVAGDRIIDPAKVNTYMNQIGKPTAEIKQSMLENFLKESEKYKKVIGDTHANLGIDNPIQPSSLAVTQSTLGKMTPGAKLADYFAKKGIYNLAGESLGTGVGAGLGSLVGHPAMGAIVGERAFSPFITSVLPGLVNAFRKTANNAAGIKAAVDYGMAAAKGDAALKAATRGIFREGAEKSVIEPHEGDRVKLDKSLKAAQINPEGLMKVAGDIGHYLPEHATAIGQMTANAVNYLNSLRPDTSPRNPLDSKLPPNPLKQAAYTRALDIANKPLIVLSRLGQGRLTPSEVSTVKTLYPALYAKMSQQVMDSIIQSKSKGDSIPYSKRLQLSMFLGQPLDSTMTPMAIMAAQPKPQAQPPGENGGGGKPPAASSVKGLSKMGVMAQTGPQTRQASRQMQKG